MRRRVTLFMMPIMNDQYYGPRISPAEVLLERPKRTLRSQTSDKAPGNRLFWEITRIVYRKKTCAFNIYTNDGGHCSCKEHSRQRSTCGSGGPSRHFDRDDPHPNILFSYPWFSAFFLPCSRWGFSQGGRASLNFLLPRNDITMLCSTMKRYSKSPLTIA